MIGAPDVDDAVEPALELGAVVADVAGKVGKLSVALDERAIFVVTEVGRTKPSRAIQLIDAACRIERGNGVVDGAVGP